MVNVATRSQRSALSLKILVMPVTIIRDKKRGFLKVFFPYFLSGTSRGLVWWRVRWSSPSQPLASVRIYPRIILKWWLETSQSLTSATGSLSRRRGEVRKREKNREKGSPVELATGGDVLAALQFLVTLCHVRGVGMTRC